jgi:hypothetical protein
LEAVCKQAGIETVADTGFIADVNLFHICEIRIFGKIEKIAGATARNLYFDYVKYTPSRSVPR